MKDCCTYHRHKHWLRVLEAASETLVNFACGGAILGVIVPVANMAAGLPFTVLLCLVARTILRICSFWLEHYVTRAEAREQQAVMQSMLSALREAAEGAESRRGATLPN